MSWHRANPGHTAPTRYFGTIIVVDAGDGGAADDRPPQCACELLSVDCLDAIRCLPSLRDDDVRRRLVAGGVSVRRRIKEGFPPEVPWRDGYSRANTPLGKAAQYAAIDAWTDLKRGRGLPREFFNEADPFVDASRYPKCRDGGLEGKNCFFRGAYRREDLDDLEEEALEAHASASSDDATTIARRSAEDMLEDDPFVTFAHVLRIIFNRRFTVRDIYDGHLATEHPSNGTRPSSTTANNSTTTTIWRVSVHMRRADACRHESEGSFRRRPSPIDSTAQYSWARVCYATSVYMDALRRVRDMAAAEGGGAEGPPDIHVYLATDYAGSIMTEIKRGFRGLYEGMTWHYLDFSRDIFRYEGNVEGDENVKKSFIGEASVADLWHLSHGQIFIGHLGSRFSKVGYLMATARHNTFVPFFSVDGHSICCQIDESCAAMRPYITSIEDCLTFASDLSAIEEGDNYGEVGTTKRKTAKLASVGLLGDPGFEYWLGDEANKKAPIADWDYFPEDERTKMQLVEEPFADGDDFDSARCEAYLKINTAPPKHRPASNGACDGYDGVLHIQHFDPGGASGTAFFQIMIGFLQWADQHNYLAWMHMDDGVTVPIWDEAVHTQGPDRTFTMMHGVEVGAARDKSDPQYWLFPGRPYPVGKYTPTNFTVKGTGVWEHYFMPLTGFVPGDPSCVGKPLVRYKYYDIGMLHVTAPWGPRAWRYGSADYVYRHDLSFDEWFEPQRRHAAEAVKRYIRFNPTMEHRARCILPDPEFSLGMHIRHGDKQGAREVIPPGAFLEYAEAFVQNGGGSIYLATDSALVVEEIKERWPRHVSDRVIHQPEVAGLSRNETAAFNLGISKHRTNVEALTDILVLSKCTFLLHGLSAMSEAAMFINPRLIEGEINLEDKDQQKWKTVDYFVKKMMPRGSN